MLWQLLRLQNEIRYSPWFHGDRCTKKYNMVGNAVIEVYTGRYIQSGVGFLGRLCRRQNVWTNFGKMGRDFCSGWEVRVTGIRWEYSRLMEDASIFLFRAYALLHKTSSPRYFYGCQWSEGKGHIKSETSFQSQYMSSERSQRLLFYHHITTFTIPKFH